MSRPGILIVEDESIVALDLRMRLRNLGYDVTAIVASGEEAILQAGITLPDLIIMDIRLKGDIDGIEAAAVINTQFDIPVIFLTALNDADTKQRASNIGNHGYILKPFKVEELHAAINQALIDRK